MSEKKTFVDQIKALPWMPAASEERILAVAKAADEEIADLKQQAAQARTLVQEWRKATTDHRKISDEAFIRGQDSQAAAYHCATVALDRCADQLAAIFPEES